ncbi:DUF1428 domain-containing protein [Pelagibacterium lentulum]|uniref:RNA signal recognition particle 4.5S RNA n=1 Tax=Pelagibacterium lentulum TaxID=2029865 RepID=A0A916VZ97_9HYPH|nr:DUF1428 domain-containing protein [Pelagibacterium lentulum]GGA54433.1 hypothetical protein GCM10011499_25750 [Pelagibacterium lentulum]
MVYVQGFVAAVPTANKQAYIDQALEAYKTFKKYGATRCVECWGDDVPKGEKTDFHMAVQAKEDEAVVFSWVEFPDRATYDECNRKMMEEFSPDDFAKMPFDGSRMIFGGFTPIVDQ